MSKFLIIRFDRYNGSNSTHTNVEADNHKEAYIGYVMKEEQLERDEAEETVAEYPLQGKKQLLQCVDNEEESLIILELE